MSGAEPEFERRALREVGAPSSSRPGPPEVVDLRELLRKLWLGKWILCAIIAVFVATTATWMKLTDPLYTASMVIAPASESGAGGLAGKLSQFGGLASLAGIPLPSEETVSPFSEFIEIVISPISAQRLIEEEPTFLRVVFEDDWDMEMQDWARPDGPLSVLKAWFYEFFGLPDWTPPSATAFVQFLEDELRIEPVGTTGMKRLTISHQDPEFAMQLLVRLRRISDDIVRKSAQERTSREIAYLQRKLQIITMSEHRQSLVQLLSEQEKRMMMIQVDLPYAARVIEPARALDQPTFPNPALFLALAFAGGLLIGAVLVFALDALNSGR